MYGYGSMDSKHIPAITEMGWGEPPQYYPSCSCGWQGVSVDTYPQDQLKPYPELIPLIEQYGVKQVYRTPRQTLGEKNDALKQVLIHIDYKPEIDSEYWSNEFSIVFEEYSRKVQDKEYELTLSVGKNLTALNQELLNMKQRIEIFNNNESAIPELNVELYEKVEKIIEEHRKEVFTIGEPGFFDNDRI